MKAKTRFALSMVLTLAFVFSLVGTAAAATGGNATVTPVSGDAVFSVTSVPLLKLPGQTVTTAGLIVPSGFPLGEKQFDGDGVEISGLSYGKAKACFPITALNQGWGGKVGYWDGSVWKLLDTSITTPEEGTFSWACATISANGTYTLITWVVDASKLVGQTTLSECSFAGGYFYNITYGYIPFNGLHIGLNVPDSVALGTPVTYVITHVDPSWGGEITGGTTGSTVVGINSPGRSAVFFDDDLTFSKTPPPSFLARFTFPTLGCYVDLPYAPFSIGG